MFVDELTIHARAGNGGNGVIRWRREKFVDRGGPAGGNGGHGGNICLRAVRDVNKLASYTGANEFKAQNGGDGEKRSRHGKDGADLIIDIPVGSRVTDFSRNRVYLFEKEGEIQTVLKGGRGGLGNEYFKSATERAPEIATHGKQGESGDLRIEVILMVDAGLIGLPNAGKSTILNTLTRASARVGAYPFTTLEPHLGDFYGYVIADIPGLIEGASLGKGLGHKFLKHIERTKVLIHCVSLEEEDPLAAYTTVQHELNHFNPEIAKKDTYIILTKTDTRDVAYVERIKKVFSAFSSHGITAISCLTEDGISEFKKLLSEILSK